MRIQSLLLSMILSVVFSTVPVKVFAEAKWVDVTSLYFKNPSFDTQDKSDWEFRGDAKAFARIDNSAIEMWEGWMEASRDLSLPNGHYRFSMQGLFRFRRHVWAYPQFLDGTEEHSAFIEINDKRVEVVSEYTFFFDSETQDCYKPDNENKWFPNSMATAERAFNAGAYPNMLEVDVTNGKMHIFIYNEKEMKHTDNWLIFDQIKLEKLEEINDPTAGDLCINEIVAANVDLEFSPAYNFDGWIEIFNSSTKALTLGGCTLSDDEGNSWRLPDSFGKIEAKGFRRIWLGSNDINPQQAPFKLDCEGGAISLANARGQLLCNQEYPEAISRTAYARTTDGGDIWSWTDIPTPEATNATANYANERAQAPVARDGQVFESSLRVTCRRPSGMTLRYTTDGTTPTMSNGETSTTGIFNINETTTFRFRYYASGKLPSAVVTRTYLKEDHEHTLPIILVNTNKDYLYDDMVGVYTRGTNGRTGNGQSEPANWNMDWDRPVNFQYIMPGSDVMVLNQDVDFAISGGWTRGGWPKSFKLKADRVYEDQNTLPYPFFNTKPYIRNKTLQVRYGGNDTGCRIKDAALHEIIQRSGIDLDVMSYQPAVHYINGDYRGLINIREPNNKDFVYANWALKKNEIEMYEQSPDSGAFMMIGRPDILNRLYELSANAADANTYAEICDLVDIDEYTNYMAAELYLGSWDWPDNNLKAYRAIDGGRYRLTFFDLDAAFGTDGRSMDEENEIYIGGNTFKWIDGMQWHRYDYIYDTGERLYGEIKFCTFFLNMLENPDFRRRFIDTFCAMGSVFEPTRSAAICDELGNRVRETMSWEGAGPDGSLDEIRSKLQGRANSLANQMKSYERFRLSDVTPLQIQITTNIPGGDIYINDVRVPYAEYNGKIFPPMTLRAEAHGGYRFVAWYDADDMTRPISGYAKLELPTSNNKHYIASFRKLNTRERKTYPDVRINEVSAANEIFANDNFKRNDWIELYNTTENDIDIAGMFLSDDSTDPHKYQITAEGTTASTIIPAHGHTIVWCDNQDGISQLHAAFKLASEGGIVSITAADDSWTDIIYYPAHDGKHTVGRYPDGSENVFVMNIPTINKTNIRSSYMEVFDQIAAGLQSPKDNDTSSLHIRYAGGRLTLRSSETEHADISIFTPDGREVMHTTVTLIAGYAEVDCYALPAGTFIVRATDDNKQNITSKFIR